MVEQKTKSPQFEPHTSKIKSPTQIPRRELQSKAPLYASPANNGSSTKKHSKPSNIGGGIPRSLSTSHRAIADTLIQLPEDRSFDRFQNLHDKNEEDSILLRSSRSDLRSQSSSSKRKDPRTAFIGSNDKVIEMPLQFLNTDRTHDSLGQHTNEEPIISASYAVPQLSHLILRQKNSCDNIRTSDERSSDPTYQDDFQLRGSYNASAMKHLYSIKPLSGAKHQFHLTSSFSSTSGMLANTRFNQTSYVNTQTKQKPGAQSHRALSTTTENLNRSYNANQDDVQKLIEQIQNDFQKQMRRKENDWSTKEALLTQKVEFLEAEVRDLKQREAKQKLMYQQMIEAMARSTPQTPIPVKRQEASEVRRESILNDSASQTHILELEQMYQARLDQARHETQELQREARQKQQSSAASIKELQIRIETFQIDHQRQIQELQLDKKSLENQIKRLQLDKTQLETQVELTDSLDQQLTQMRQQLEVIEKEKAILTEKMRKQVREHNDALVKNEKLIQERAAERVRQVEKDAREKEIQMEERLERQLQDATDENLRQIEHMQEMHTQVRQKLEGHLHQALLAKQMEADRREQIERTLGQNKYEQSQSLFGTQVFNDKLSTHFGQFLENDTSSIQCSESQIIAYDECNMRDKRVRDSQTEEVWALKAQLDKLKSKLKEARQFNEELIEREKTQHKKHKQQIEHVLMSIFLSDRYIKEGVSVDDVQSLAKDELNGQHIKEVYQKMINDEVQARLTCETQLQEIKHQLQQVRGQAQDQLGERDNQIKGLSAEIKNLKAEVDFFKNAEKENREKLANQPSGNLAKINDEVFTPQKISNTKNTRNSQNQSLQPNSKQNRPPSQSGLYKPSKEPQAPQLLHKTTQNAQVSTLQLKLLKSCQLMVDAASRMECSQCLQLFTTTDFYEHITTESGTFQCLNHVKMMTNLSHQMSTRQQNRSFQNVSSSQNIVNFKSQLNLIKPRESSAGNLSQFRKAHNSSSLFFHKQRSSLGASVAASSTSHVGSGVPLPLMFHRTSQASGPLFHHVSIANPNTTQAFDNTMEESSILQQAPTLNTSTYQQFTQQLNAMQSSEGLQGLSRPQSALISGPSQNATFQQATHKMNAQAQKLTRNSNVKGALQMAKSAEHAKFPEISEHRKTAILDGPRPYSKPTQSSQAVQPLQIKNKTQNTLQSFFSHSHHQTQVNWSQKSWNQFNTSKEQPVNMSSISQLPPHPVIMPRRSKAEEKPTELSNHKRAQSFTNGRTVQETHQKLKQPEGSILKPSPSKPDRISRMTRHTRGSSLKTANNPELGAVIASHLASINENQIISVSQDMYPKQRFPNPINSDLLEGMICAGEVINLDENIDRGMPLQDEGESIRTGSSLQQSDSSIVSSKHDQIGNGFFKQNYRQGDEKGTSFKRNQDALLSGKLAASNYFREDSATEAQPLEQELDSASDWYGSVSNQQNQEMLIAEKQLQMKIEREKVQGNKVFSGLSIPRQRIEVVPRLNLQGQQIQNQQKGQKPGKNEVKEIKRANYATQLMHQEKNKTTREPVKRIEKADFGQTQPVSFITKTLEIDAFEQSGNTNAYKLDSFRAYGKPYCTSTKGGQRYDKSNLLVSQSMNNLDQVLDTQIDSRASQPAIDDKLPQLNKLNLEQVARTGQNESSSRTTSQLNAPRAGRLPTSSDYQVDSVMRSEVSDSLAPDDYVITKDETITQREGDGSITTRLYIPSKPDFTTTQTSQAPELLLRKKQETKKATVGIRDLNILMNMVAKCDKNKIPPIPKRLADKGKGRINEGSHAVEYFFNETEPARTSKRNMNSVPRKSPLFDKDFELVEREMQLVQVRRSRFKTQSDDDIALIDSCEEDQGFWRDECDIDSTELQEEQQRQSEVKAYDDTQKDEFEDAPKSSGFSLFMCGGIKDKGTEFRSFFKPLAAQESVDQGRKRLGAQKTFKPSLMANQSRKFDASNKSLMGLKLN